LPLSLTDRTEALDESPVRLARLDRETWQRVAVVCAIERSALVDGAGEKAAPQRAVGHETDAQLCTGGEHLVLRTPPPQRILALDCGDRLDGMRTADRLRAGLGKAEAPDLALRDQVPDRAGDLRGGDQTQAPAPLLFTVLMITAVDVRAVAAALPRTEEHLIRERIKFRVGKIVYASISPDDTILGFGYPKEERAALIAGRPDVFFLERLSDQRFQWVDARMARLDQGEMSELIIDAWRMVVPKKVAAAQSMPTWACAPSPAGSATRLA
jgi:hypothetical protein